MNLLGTVVSINLETQAKGTKGMYPAYEIIYRNADGEVKTMAKHLNGLKYNKPLANGLGELVAGDKFTIEQDKNEGGYWEPKIAYKGWKEDTPAAASSSAAVKSSGGGDNTFAVGNKLKEKQQELDETRQPLIVRQTCLTAAANLAVPLKLKTEADVIAQAKRFEDFIWDRDPGGLADMANDNMGVE